MHFEMVENYTFKAKWQILAVLRKIQVFKVWFVATGEWLRKFQVLYIGLLSGRKCRLKLSFYLQFLQYIVVIL